MERGKKGGTCFQPTSRKKKSPEQRGREIQVPTCGGRSGTIGKKKKEEHDPAGRARNINAPLRGGRGARIGRKAGWGGASLGEETALRGHQRKREKRLFRFGGFSLGGKGRRASLGGEKLPSVVEGKREGSQKARGGARRERDPKGSRAASQIKEGKGGPHLI